MLSTELSTAFVIVCALFVIFAGFIYWWCLRLANFCRDAIAWVQSENKKSVSLARIADLETSLTELSDAYDALLTSHKKLRSRIGMRNVRESRKNDAELGEAPAGEAERAAYKSQLREQAKSKGLLR